MKKKGIFWGVALICAALLLLLDGFGTGLGFLNGIPVVRIILGVACLSWMISELFKKQISHIFFPLAFIFMLFEGEIATLCGSKETEIMSNWLVLLCALLMTIGTSMIFSKTKWSEKDYDVNSTFKSKHKIMGKSTRYIDCATFNYQTIENNMGSTEIFFENIDAYLGNGTITIENNMGATTIHVPCQWHIIADCDNNLGSVTIPKNQDTNGKVLNINGENNLGSITIVND